MTARRLTLRGRLALLSALAVAVVVCAVSVGAFALVRAELLDSVDDQLLTQSAIAAQGELLERVRPPRLDASPLVAGLQPLRVQLRTADGRLLAVEGEALSVDDVDTAVQDGTLRTQLRTRQVDGQRVRLVSRRTSTGGLLQIARPLDDVDRSLRRLSLLFALLGVAGAAAAGIAGRVVARTGLAPVTRLARAAEDVAATTDLEAALPVEGDDEIARVARSVNAVLTALGQARDQQRRLVEDAGHELRTPLTSLRANVELLLRADAAGTPLPDADRRALLDDVRSQVVELAHLVQELVALAREDAEPERPRLLDLAEIVQRAAARTRRDRPAADVRVQAGPLLVHGQPAALERAIGNLLDNAVKFGSPGASVECLVIEDDRDAVVEVRDRGRGIDAADRERVLQRFARADDAQSVPGSGLGLAIVRQAAERHGGRVELLARESGGTVARLVLSRGPHQLSRTSQSALKTGSRGAPSLGSDGRE